MVVTTGKHYWIILNTKGKKCLYILFVEDQEEELTSFKAIRKVHEVNNHKKREQLITAYRNAGWISPDVVNTINHVVNDCHVCQKFQKSVKRPKVTLPKSSSFNKVVTLDLKEMGSKYILWMVDSFTKFIQGKLIHNKMAETVIDAINTAWNCYVGYPSIGYFADNGREFANIKLDELTSEHSRTLKFGPSYSPWSNGINEWNHASADIMIRKMMEDKKTPLKDTLVKAAV